MGHEALHLSAGGRPRPGPSASPRRDKAAARPRGAVPAPLPSAPSSARARRRRVREAGPASASPAAVEAPGRPVPPRPRSPVDAIFSPSSSALPTSGRRPALRMRRPAPAARTTTAAGGEPPGGHAPTGRPAPPRRSPPSSRNRSRLGTRRPPLGRAVLPPRWALPPPRRAAGWYSPGPLGTVAQEPFRAGGVGWWRDVIARRHAAVRGAAPDVTHQQRASRDVTRRHTSRASDTAGQAGCRAASPRWDPYTLPAQCVRDGVTSRVTSCVMSPHHTATLCVCPPAP